MTTRRAKAKALWAVLLAVAAPAAFACGLEDPGSIAMRRGSLNLAYPQSLHTGTAIWQAQLAGALPHDPLAQRDDLTPEARATLRLVQANSLLMRFAATLRPPATGAPSLAVVLLGPVLWSRFEAAAAGVRPTTHVDGPQAGDVVVVTDIAVLEAITTGKLSSDDALARGLMRLYGSPQQIAAGRRWFAPPARG